jgi:hypothetical protein
MYWILSFNYWSLLHSYIKDVNGDGLLDSRGCFWKVLPSLIRNIFFSGGSHNTLRAQALQTKH